MKSRIGQALLPVLFVVATSISGVSAQEVNNQAAENFTIAVIPDAQNYLDFRHQIAADFPFNASELFMDHMAYIARNTVSSGGDIAFVTAVGDIWQHPSSGIDKPHLDEGLKSVKNPVTELYGPDPRTKSIEMPIAKAGFELISGKVPFSVVPGNHDYDSFWADSRFPFGSPGAPYGQLHYGGLDNFNEIFGANTPFFKGRDWYVDSFNGGANSAQIFTAGGFRFLHIGLEMAPYDDVLGWASKVIARFKGLPTIVTIHDHLNTAAERKAVPSVDFDAVQAAHNNPEEVWKKFFAKHDQIFLILSGHQHGQARRTDRNEKGGLVYQILADYQDRGQVVKVVDREGKFKGTGIGDGWLRLMTFDVSKAVPTITVRTYSTVYKATATQLPTYSEWYKAVEKPQLTDEAFLNEEDFVVELTDFRNRFTPAVVPR